MEVGHVTSRDSQSQLLEGLGGVERRVGILLQNLHLVGVVDQVVPDQLVQQRLRRFVIWRKRAELKGAEGSARA